uniref:Uncharacterized protein n=1 Tax=Rhizophora mucronata TaxID=61149 RepID=A0A2P2N7S6_RHIMU
MTSCTLELSGIDLYSRTL